MYTIFTAARFIHVIAAVIALATLFIPLIVKKGGDVHRKVGWVFTIGMVIAALTGLVIALAYIIAPLEVRPAGNVERMRTFGVFLIFIGFLTLSSLNTGIAAIARKKEAQGRRFSARSILPTILLVGSAVLVVLGLKHMQVLFLFFAVIGVLSGVSDLRFFARPLETRMSWWYQHMNGMGTAAIAAVTAFLVFNAERITQGSLPAAWRFIPWILPSIAGAPMIALWIRRYRRRFDEVT